MSCARFIAFLQSQITAQVMHIVMQTSTTISPSTAPRPTGTPAPAPAHTPRQTPAATATPTNTPLPRLLFLLNNLLPLRRSFLLPPPVASLFIVFANSQRTAQLLTLLDLRLRQLVYLVALQSPRTRTASVTRLLGFEFLAQSGALVVDGVFVNPIRKKKVKSISKALRIAIAKTSLHPQQCGGQENSLFLLQPISQFKHFHFNLAFPLVLDYPLVWLALAVLEVFDCARVRRGVVAGFEVCAVALDVA